MIVSALLRIYMWNAIVSVSVALSLSLVGEQGLCLFMTSFEHGQYVHGGHILIGERLSLYSIVG